MTRRVLALWLWCAVAPTPLYATTIAVHAADNLQTAINASACGDTLVLDAGVTWTGNFTLPNHGCVTYTTITSSGAIPAPGVRVLPADSPQLAHIVTINNTAGIGIADDADYWQIIGIEVSSTYGTPIGAQDNLIWGGFYTATSGALPDHIIFDRVYVHGSATNEENVGFAVNGSNITIKNSRCEEVHAVNFEAECIQTFNGPGPMLVDNNYLSSAGEVFMSGGNSPFIHNMIMDGLTFTNNYLTKDCRWYIDAANVGCVYNVLNFNVKNTFELKAATNALVDHNIMENPLIGGGQTGEVVIMQSNNPPWNGVAPDYNCPICGVSNVTFTNNILRHGNEGIVICGNCFLGGSPPTPAMTVTTVNHITIRNNLIYDMHRVWGGDGRCGKIGNDASFVAWSHNTCVNDDAGITYPMALLLFGHYVAGFDAKYYTVPDLSIKDSFFGGYTYGLKADAGGEGTAALVQYVPAGYTFLNNVIASDVGGGPYPPTTDRPSVATWRAQFTDLTSTSNHADNAVDYRLIGGSVYKAGGAKQASDGTDVGVNDWSALPDPLGDGKTPFGGGGVVVPPPTAPVRLPFRVH